MFKSMQRIIQWAEMCIRDSSGVDPLGNLVDIPTNGGKLFGKCLDICGVRIDDISVNRHLAEVSAISACG